jgi:hypothetical protein
MRKKCEVDNLCHVTFVSVCSDCISLTKIDHGTRGSQEPVIANLVFNLTYKVVRKWGVLHIILKVGHPKIISTQISEQKILM